MLFANTWNLLNDSGSGSYPAFNVYATDELVTVTSEIPGVEPDALEISVEEDILSVAFTRPAETLDEKKGERLLRRERPRGRFSRRIALPYPVEKDEVQATAQAGILRIELPRAKEQRPRKISVQVA